MTLTQEQKFKFRMRLEQEQEQSQSSGNQSQAYQPSFIESAADKITGYQNQLGQFSAKPAEMIGRASNFLTTGIPMNSAGDAMQVFGDTVGKGLEKVEGASAEYLGKKGVNPYVAAAIPMAVEYGASLLTPGAKAGIAGRNLLEPKVPAARQEGVAAMKSLGMKPTWAQQTGSKIATALENFTEKTPLGSGPLEERAAFNAGKLEDARKVLSKDLGTQEDVYTVGQKAQAGQAARTAAMNAKRTEMFQNVPDVKIPLGHSVEAADEIVMEQSKYLPTTRNSDVVALAADVQDASKAVAAGTSNYSTIRRLREVLNKRIESNNAGIQSGLPGQSNAVARDYIRLKEALDKDIDQFSAGLPEKPYGSKQGDPHALFAYNDDFGPGGSKRAVYNVFGNPDDPRIKKVGFGSSLDKEALDKAGIPITGKQPNAKGVPAGEEFSGAEEFGKSYRKANAVSGAYQQVFKSDEARALANADPNKVYDSIFKSNNESAIKRYRATIGDDAFQSSKRKFAQEIIDSPNASKELEKYEPGTLRAIFTEPELKDLQRYGLAQKAHKEVGNLQGTQGSARSNIQAGSYTGLGAGILALLTGNIPAAALGIGQYVAPRAISRSYLGASEGALSTGVSRGVASGGKRALLAAYVNSRDRKKK